MAPNLRFRFLASGTHAFVSVSIALMVFAIVYFVWYPAPLFELSAGKDLFLLVVAVDIVLGPLLTLVVADRRKRRPELVRDIGIIALVQVGALAYGLNVVAQARPVFIVYNAGQFNVVNANDIDNAELAKANAPYNRLPIWGPQLVAAATPKDERERTEIMFSALSGGSDVYHMPRYYEPYESVQAEVAGRAMKAAEFKSRFKGAELGQPGSSLPEDAGYLPLVVRRHVVAAAVSRVDGRLLHIEQVDNIGP